MSEKGILKGYRVIDLADEKGSFCSRLLGDMGAEIIRVQKPGSAPEKNYANSGKHCISLNIETEKGQFLFKSLVKSSPILIESYKPGYLSSLGLSYKDLSKINPQLIMASITDFGQNGPYRDYCSSPLVASALGGQLFVCGEPGKTPLKPFGQQPYMTASLFAANGIMLAIWQKGISGEGQYIDISIHECTAAALDHVLVRYFANGEIAERQGNLYWNDAFCIFPCEDSYILLSLLYQWDTLIELLDSEGMAEDLRQEKWNDEGERRNNIQHIIVVLGKWTRKHSVDELVEIGQAMRFPWAKVESLPGLVENVQLNERGYFQEVNDLKAGKTCKFPGSPFKMSRTPLEVRPQMPGAGDYNQRIYQEEMGLSEEDMERYRNEGII